MYLQRGGAIKDRKGRDARKKFGIVRQPGKSPSFQCFPGHVVFSLVLRLRFIKSTELKAKNCEVAGRTLARIAPGGGQISVATLLLPAKPRKQLLVPMQLLQDYAVQTLFVLRCFNHTLRQLFGGKETWPKAMKTRTLLSGTP